MKLGLSTLLYRNRPLNRDLLAVFQKAGIESVELTDYHPGFSYEDVPFFVGFGKEIEGLGLHLNSLHIHLDKFDPEFDLATLAHREKALSAYRRAIEAMAAMGGGILVSHDIRIPEPSEDAHSEKRAAFLENLGTVAGYAGPQGVRLVLENTSKGYTREPDRLVGLIEDLGAPNVGVVIDTGHRNLVGDPVDALRRTGAHLLTLHIHDNGGENDEHLLPGKGNIAWEGVLQALVDVAYSGVFMYELSRAEDVPAVRSNFEALVRKGAGI